MRELKILLASAGLYYITPALALFGPATVIILAIMAMSFKDKYPIIFWATLSSLALIIILNVISSTARKITLTAIFIGVLAIATLVIRTALISTINHS